MSRPSSSVSLLSITCAFGLGLLSGPGCTSLSYAEPDETPAPPVVVQAAKPHAPKDPTWAESANTAREALRVRDLDVAEREYLASLAATQVYGDRDVRRQTALANPAQLVEAYQEAGRLYDADRLTNAILAEAQGGKPFPLDAWTPALETQLDLARASGGGGAELEWAERIAQIHFGPLQNASEGEVRLRRRVGLLLAEADEVQLARAQLGWAARAAVPLLRIAPDERVALQHEAATASEQAGDPLSAELHLDAAVEIARTSGDDLLLATALNQLGWFRVEHGRAEQALEPLAEALALLETAGASPALRAAILDSHAVALHRTGRLDEAEVVFAQAISARDASSPEEQASLSSIDEHRAELEAARSAEPASSANDS